MRRNNQPRRRESFRAGFFQTKIKHLGTPHAVKKATIAMGPQNFRLRTVMDCVQGCPGAAQVGEALGPVSLAAVCLTVAARMLKSCTANRVTIAMANSNFWALQLLGKPTLITPATVRFALAGGGLKLLAAGVDMQNTGESHHDLRLAVHRTKHHMIHI